MALSLLARVARHLWSRRWGDTEKERRRVVAGIGYQINELPTHIQDLMTLPGIGVRLPACLRQLINEVSELGSGG